MVKKLGCEATIHRRLLGQLDGHELVVHFAILLVVLDPLRLSISTTLLDGLGNLHLVHATLRIRPIADRSSHHRGAQKKRNGQTAKRLVVGFPTTSFPFFLGTGWVQTQLKSGEVQE